MLRDDWLSDDPNHERRVRSARAAVRGALRNSTTDTGPGGDGEYLRLLAEDVTGFRRYNSPASSGDLAELAGIANVAQDEEGEIIEQENNETPANLRAAVNSPVFKNAMNYFKRQGELEANVGL